MPEKRDFLLGAAALIGAAAFSISPAQAVGNTDDRAVFSIDRAAWTEAMSDGEISAQEAEDFVHEFMHSEGYLCFGGSVKGMRMAKVVRQGDKWEVGVKLFRGAVPVENLTFYVPATD